MQYAVTVQGEDMESELIRKLTDFIESCPSQWHVAAAQAERLEEAGYARLREGETWDLEAGGKYYVIRNDSALIAFRIPAAEVYRGFVIMASHSDTPVLRLKENPEVHTGAYVMLNAEIYGGALLSPWFDRTLGIAGRAVIRNGEGLRSVPVDLGPDLALIPSLAIHMDRQANEGRKINIQKEMMPLYGLGDAGTIRDRAASAAGCRIDDVLGTDLILYNAQKAQVWGAEGEFLSAPRIDDNVCAFASMEGFLDESGDAQPGVIPVHAVFDNEEVGSSTRQGAASTFLYDVLMRICVSLAAGTVSSPDTDASAEAAGEDPQVLFRRMTACSFMLSADNGHALHPNYPEKCDPVNRPVMGEGVLLKFSANQKYTTDAVSSAVVRYIAEDADVKLQVFTNRSDVPGGSTLGNISGNQVPVVTADIGLPQLAMHSPFETCAVSDVKTLVRLAEELFRGRAVQLLTEM